MTDSSWLWWSSFVFLLGNRTLFLSSVLVTFLFCQVRLWLSLWIPRSKIIGSNWELISRFRCLLASWIPGFDFFEAIWEAQCCKCFKIHGQHSSWFLKRYKNCLSGNCFSLRCKYLVKQFPACCFILKNGNSWMNAQLIRSKKSKLKSFFSWFGNSWFPRYLTTKNSHRPLTRLTTIGSISDQISE